MDRKMALSAVIIFTFVGSLAAELQAVEMAEADFPFNIVIKVDSPQNITYNTNDIHLSFSYDTNIINSPSITNYSVVFDYNIDGQPIFYSGHPVFSGDTIRIGQFYQPVPLTYNSSIHVPNGNHSIFVFVTFWIKPNDIYPNTFRVHNVSQVVNFTVYAETPTSTPSQSPSPSPTHSMTQQPSLSPTPTITPIISPSNSPTQRLTLSPIQTSTPDPTVTATVPEFSAWIILPTLGAIAVCIKMLRKRAMAK